MTDLYRFKVRRVEVIPIYNLSEPYVLEQQITEFMKYRAPIQAVGEFLEKLKSMAGLSKEGEIVERNMALDKLLNGMREDMVCFALLMEKKMKNINRVDKYESYSREVIRTVSENNQTIKNSKPKEELISDINKKMADYKTVKARCDEAKNAYDIAFKEFESVDKKKKDLQRQLDEKRKKKAEAETGESKGEGQDTDSSGDLEIQRIEEEIRKLQPEHESKRSANESALQNYTRIHYEKSLMEKSIDTQLNKVLSCYEQMYSFHDVSMCYLMFLYDDLALHESYCRMAIELGQELITQAQQVHGEKTALESSMSQSPDSAVAQGIKADLEKKIACADPGNLEQILGRLQENLANVTGWKDAVFEVYCEYVKIDGSLKNEIDKIKELINDKGDGSNVVSMYTGYDDINIHLDKLKTGLTGLSSYSDMEAGGTYVIPEYKLTPPVTEKEQKLFEVWYANNFGGMSPELEKEAENPGLENARKKTGDTARAIQGEESEEEDDKSGSSKKDGEAGGFYKTLEKLLGQEKLPSLGGTESSGDSLAGIAEHVWQTEQDRFGIKNPMEDPIEGVDTVNEEDKGFFDNALERIREFFGAIGKLLEDAGESLVKSLYMNEYIVSAFKNFTTVGNVLEHDIGWLRPLDKTFFDKAEVEYIIFGKISEKANIAAAKRSIILIRLVFNLLHVYTDPEKLAETLSAATMIAGWTIFGVPIVQNFLLISWAAAESWLDAEKLMSGKQVPLIKTRQSWELDWGMLYDYLINNVIGSVRDFVVEKAEKMIDEGAKYLEETVMAFISSQLDIIFSKITDTWVEASGTVSQEAQDLVNSISLDDIDGVAGDTVEGFLESLRDYMVSKLASFCESIRDKGAKVIADCKKALLDKISNLLFNESSAFSKLKEKVKDFAKETIEKGFDAVAGKISGVLGGSGGGSSGANNVLGRIIMMDYTDYLRLLLLTVTPEDKALRCADLIQLNMKTALPDNARPIKDYHTYLYVKAWIDIDLWVIPEEWFKKDKEAMIVVE